MSSKSVKNGAIYSFAVLFLAVFVYSAIAQEKDKGKADLEVMLQLRIEVRAGEKAAPVDLASVYIRYLIKHVLGKDEIIEMNFKSNKDGVVVAPSVPRGRVLVQVVAEGWKPFGNYFELTEDGQTVKVKLEKPPKWY